MKAIVTGGTGFIGSHVVDILVQNGHSVRLFSRKAEMPERLNSSDVELVQGNLKDHDSVLDAMEGMDVIFHIGEIKNTSRTAAERNTRLVERMVDHLSQTKFSRFVFISSLSVAGIPSEFPADEETKPSIVLKDHYTEYKRASERIIAERCPRAAYCIIRPAIVYGPRSRHLGRLIELVKRLGPLGLPLVGKARNLAPFVQVQDLAAAIYLAGTVEAATGKTFNITDGQAESWFDFFESMAAGRPLRILPIPPILARMPALLGDILSGVFGAAADFSSYVSYLSRDVHFSNRHAVAVLGWKPAYTDIAVGVGEMIDWYSQKRKARG